MTYIEGQGLPYHGQLPGLEANDHPQYMLDSEFVSYSGALQSQIDGNTILITTTSGYLQGEIDSIGGSIITDHGLLTGLGDDDHTQYVLHNYDVGVGNFVASVGSVALQSGASDNILIGTDAGDNINTGDYNICIGKDAGTAITTGYDNIVIGRSAGSTFTTGFSNVLIGGESGKDMTTAANSNICIGPRSGKAITTGARNTCIGYQTTFNNPCTGNDNILIGFSVGQYLTTGSNNVIIGNDYIAAITTGSNNTIIGYGAGYTLDSSDSGNVFIGCYAGRNEAGSNKLYIDNSATTTPLIYGDFTSNYVWVNYTFGVRDGGEIRFYDSGNSNYVGFEAPALTGNQIWVLPTADSSNGFVMKTNGAGTLSWIDHGGLAGKSDDDHTQYLLVNGTRNAATLGITGDLSVGGKTNIASNVPASAGAAGTAGDVAWDSDFIYICVATNTWKRAALSTWP
jgi:hypothetical protein